MIVVPGEAAGTQRATMVPIGTFCDLVNGFPFNSDDFSLSHGMPLLRIRDIKSNSFEMFIAEGLVGQEHIVHQGDLVVGMDGDFNSVIWTRDSAALNQRVCVLRPKPGTDIRFVAYQLPEILKVVNELTFSTTVKHLSSAQLLKTRISVSEEYSQKEIADFLDRETAQIDELIAKQEQLATGLTEKLLGAMTHAVTRGLDDAIETKPVAVEWIQQIPVHWHMSPVSRIGQVTLGKMLQPNPGSPTDVRTSYLRAANVQPLGKLDLTTSKQMWVRPGEGPSLSIRANDVVVVEGGMGGFGRAALVKQDVTDWVFQNSINRVRVVKEYSPAFLAYTLIAAREAGFLHAICAAVSMPHFTAEKLSQFRVPVPPFAEQIKIVRHLDRLSQQLDVLQAKTAETIALLKERRQALISAAVTGKIDVTGKV